MYEFEPACHLGAKLAGVHWWFKSRAHAAELTAGYYNTRERDGYADLMAVAKKNNVRLSFTCVEMRDCEHPPEGRCSPEGVGGVSCVCVLSSWQHCCLPFSGKHCVIQDKAFEHMAPYVLSIGPFLYRCYYRNHEGSMRLVLLECTFKSTVACGPSKADSDLLCCVLAGLLQQVIEAAAAAGVPLSGENALQRYDQYAFDRCPFTRPALLRLVV